MKIDEVIKNPDIDNLEDGSIQKKLYDELYQQFYEAQTPKSPDFPYGIEKGDQTDIRLMNSAYGFAKTVGDSIIVGSTGSEIDITNLVKKSGDTMTGELRLIRGMSAGENGRITLSTKTDNDNVSYIDILTYLSIPQRGLKIGDANVIYRKTDLQTTIIEDKIVNIIADKVNLPENTTIGDFVFSENGIESLDKVFYHTKNANLDSVDWVTKNLSVFGNAVFNKDILVNGKSTLMGVLSLEDDNENILFNVDSHKVNVNLPIYVKDTIYVGSTRTIQKRDNGIVIEAVDTDLIIGSSNTNSIKLSSDLKTWNNDSTIITPSGYGNFNMGFQASHDKSKFVIKTYRKENSEQGVIINDNIRFLDENGLYLSHDKNKDGLKIGYESGGSILFYRDLSNSIYKPLNRDSYSTYIDSDDDFIVLSKPVEANSFTISGKETQISDGLIKFNKNIMLEGLDKYMALHGNVVVKNNLTTDNFSTGFAGSGWGIVNNPVNGITSLTIDEATIRRKMRIYELEVQSISATNGSLWVSDSLSGDNVTQII